jgi:uncharacterized membrane protein YkoI
MRRSKRFNLANGILMGAMALIAGTSVAEAEKEQSEKKITGTIHATQLKHADFVKSAKISPSQASKTAIGVEPGDVISVGLEKEDGFLVYEVNIASAKHGVREILVDAGSGAILSNEKETESAHNGFAKEREDDEDDDD